MASKISAASVFPPRSSSSAPGAGRAPSSSGNSSAESSLFDNDDSTPLDATGGLHEILSHSEVNALIQGKRSDVEGIKRFLIHFSFIAAGIWFLACSLSLSSPSSSSSTASSSSASFSLGVSSSLGFLVPLVWVGYCLSFLFMALHETVHQTAFRSVFLNTAVAHLCGFLIFRFPRHYKLYHFSHHRWTGDKEKDPELQDSWLDPNIETLPGYLIYLTGFMFWVDRIALILRHVLGIFLPSEFYISSVVSRRRVCWEARCFFSLYVILALLFSSAGRLDVLWYYWLLPSLLGQVNLRFYLLSEHVGCQRNSSNMLLNTRTTKTWWLTRLLAWEMPWHTEHHAYPNVPFYMLPLIHQKLEGKSIQLSQCVPNGENGYFASHASILKKILNEKPVNATTAETSRRHKTD